MFELVEVKEDENGVQLVSAKELHKFLEVGRDFSTWIKGRISKYGLIENKDFQRVSMIPQTGGIKNKGGDVKSVDYILPIKTAYSLCMVENNSQGKLVRDYFINCEELLKKKRIEEKEIKVLEFKNKSLELDATKIKLESCKDIIRRVKPYYNIMKTIFNGKELQSLGVVAKLLCTDEFAIGRTQLMAFLRDEKVLLKDNTASQRYVISGCFNVRYKSVVDGEGELKYKPVTLVTGKGFMFIKRLVDKKYNK